MSTSLHIIFKSEIKDKTNFQLAEYVLPKLKALNIYPAINHDGTIDVCEWTIQIDDYFKEENNLAIVNVNNPTPYPIISIYENCVSIYTIYRYSLIYQNYTLDWFNLFRKNIYKIIQQFKATEIIYLADNNNPLCGFLEGMVQENVAYDIVKERMIKKFGQPITDYKKLNYDSLDYKKINFFFLDTFADLK